MEESGKMIIAILNDHVELAPRVQNEKRALEEAGHVVEVLCWKRKVTIWSWLFLPLFYVRAWYWLGWHTHVHVTHVFLLPLAIVWARHVNSKVIYDCFEFYAQYRWWLKPIESWLVRRCDGVLTVTSVSNIFSSRIKANCPNTEILFNVPYLRDNLIAQRDNHIIAYAGKLQENKGKATMFDVIRMLEKEYPDVRIDLINGLAYDDMLERLSHASVGLALYQPDLGYKLQTFGNASKCFVYMQAGLPIIGPQWGSLGDIIRITKCGLLCDTTDPQSVVDAISRLWGNPDVTHKMAENGLAAIRDKYNFEVEKPKLMKVYRRACGL